MRIRMIPLMALVTCLLITGPGLTQAPSADPADSNTSLRSGNSLDPSSGTDEISTDEVSPPTSRPAQGPSALAANPLAGPVTLNPALEGVVAQLRAGVDTEVLLKHVQTSSEPFNISSDEIVFLTDLGAPGEVISAMIERDSELMSRQTAVDPQAKRGEPWPPAGTVVEVPSTSETSATSTSAPLGGQEGIVTERPAEQIKVDYFYDSLAPYGTWINVSEYGLCWQPTVAISTPGWMPYGDRGRWLYSDYGWYWYSDYSWGWAAFHYGRWFHHTQWGWCWKPGTVWGPSWVSWRFAAPYCGWAPLPPYRRSGVYVSVGISWGIPSWCYTYLPSYRICSDYPRRHAIPYAKARHIHQKSRVRNHYAVGRNHTIENRGIPPEDLTDHSESDIRRAKVSKRHEQPAGSLRRERLDGTTQTLTVYEPRPDARRAPPGQTQLHSKPPARTHSVEPSRTRNRDVADGSSGATPHGELSEPSSRKHGVDPAPIQGPLTRTRETEQEATTTRVNRSKNSLVIIGTRGSQATSTTSARTYPQTPNQLTPTTPPASVAGTPARVETIRSQQIRSEVAPSPAPAQMWAAPATRTQSARSAISSSPRSVQSRSVTRITPAPSRRTVIRQSPTPSSIQRTPIPTRRTGIQSSRPSARPPTPQQATPSRPSSRSAFTPAPSTRATPPVRTAPNISRTPRQAPAYTPTPTTRRSISASPRSSPQSASPNRSGERSGNRNR